MKKSLRNRLAPVLVPLGFLVILLTLNQTDRVGVDGLVAAVEAAKDPTPEPERVNAKPVGEKSLVGKQAKPAAPAPLTRRQPLNARRLRDGVPFLTGPAEGDALDVTLNYVRAPENRPGYTGEDFKDPKISSRYVSKHNGVTHLFLRQRHEGIEVYGADIGVNLLPDGRIINLHNAFVTDLASEVNATEPVLTAQEAIRRAAAFYELDETQPLTPLEVAEPEPVTQKQLFSPAGISLDPIPVKLIYVPLEEGVTRLAWNTVIRFDDGERWLDLNVDAETGAVLSEVNWIACVKCEAHGMEIGKAHDCGGETAGIASETSSVMGTNYNVFSVPLESPSDGGRSVQIDPQNTAASPFGWHDTNGAAGAEFTDTRGNNVNAQEDADNNNTGGVRPNGGASLDFNFPLDLTQAPSTYTAAVTANLFYWNNIIHDVFWHYGFDEPAGNFQENNYGNGGAASDPVEADSQDGSGTNNANFGTPPDGSNPRMQMFIWTNPNPDRDSSLDNGIIIHEYGHGISNRLTGGPANSSALSNTQSRGMGEGWSDFLGLALTHQAGDTGPIGRGIGTYVLGQSPTGAGIRPFRYSTDLAVNPQHFGNLNGGGLTVPHGIGSVWCTTLWEVYWALVGVYGYDPDVYTGTGGNNIALQLVIDGMKLQPANPSFLDARDAILTADEVNNGGANFDTIWAAFAKRGMGFSAYDGGSSSSLAVVAAYDLPDDLNITPGARTPFVSTGKPGGPFSPSSQTYTLENIGDASLTWTASDNVSWLDLSVASGTLASAATTTVNATLNANANNLGLGTHTATVSFTNTVSGKTITRNVSLLVNDLKEALDSPSLTFGTSGNATWFSETTTTQDGVDAAQSGAITHNQTSSLETTLTGPGKLTFWWKVSSETNFDYLRFYLNNVEQTGSLAKISGDVNWVQKTVSIPAGSQAVKWSYTKDELESSGSDAAWLDQVVWLPLPPNSVEVYYPNGGENVYLGSAETINWAANITGNVKIDLFKGGSFHSVLAGNESNDGSYSWSVSAGLPADSDYTVKVSSVDNPAYSDTSDAAFTITQQPTLADALDTTGFTWLTSGNLPWFAQTTTTHDGVDAARSGAITHDQTSSVETTLTGPGTMTFWWKVSSESGWDFLRFYLNAVEQGGSLARISGTVDWVQKTVSIPAGSQTVRWSYTKDGSVNTGSDAGWLDQVVYTPASAPEIVVEQPVGTILIDGSATIDFGSVNVGGSSSPVAFTIRNAGNTDLTGLALSKSGTNDVDYTLGTLGATTLAPGISTTFTITFAPGAAGARTAAIQIASNDADENPFDIDLTGTGVGPGTLAVTPAGGLASSGNYGGPFSPASLVYTLSNPGNTSIDWTAAKTEGWVDLSTGSGTLAPGANTTVTVSINGNASLLNAGAYSDTVTFANTTSGTGNTTRDVSLTVNPIAASVNLSGLSQTYDGTPKPVTVTTTPSGLSHSVTYNGSATAPTNAGTYAVVATVTEPNYQGSASGNLVIAHTVSYQGNGNTNGTVPADQTKFQDVDLTLAVNSGNLNKTGFSFVGWNTAADGNGTDYPAGAIYSGNASLTLYAKWAPGADGTWTQTTAGPFDWGTAGNWSGGTVAAGADRTAFFTPNITATQTVNLESTRTIGNITFTDSSTSSHNLTISGANILTLSRTTGVPVVDVTQSNRSLTIASQISGTNGLQKDGLGTLTLSGANSFAGGLVINAGTVSVNTASLNNNAITVNGTSTLNASLDSTTSSGITLNNSNLSITGGKILTVNGAVTGNGGVTVSTSFNNFRLMSSGNNFTGPIWIGPTANSNINSMSVAVNSLGDSASAITFGYGNTTLTANEQVFSYTGSSAVILNNRYFEFGPVATTGVNGSGTIEAAGATAAASLTLLKDLVVSGTGTGITKKLTLRGANTGNNTFAGKIADGVGTSIAINKNGAGTWSLSGANTHSGGTILTTGTLIINSATALGGSASTFTITAGTIDSTAAFANQLLTNNNAQTWNGNFAFTGSQNLNMGTGAVSLGTATGTSRTVTVNANTLTIGGGISSGTTATGLTKGGAGTLLLTGTSLYSGLTTISGGTLQLGDGTATGDGTISNTSGITNNATLIYSRFGSLSSSVAISGTGAVTKTGPGSQTLNGTNTYSGITTVSAGKLFINGSLSSTAVALTVNSGATLGGTGTIGRNVTVAAGGKLEFNLSSVAASHDRLDISTGRSFGFSGASELTITSTSGASTGIYTLITGGNSITGSAPATVNLPAGWAATVSISGNSLLLDVTSTGGPGPVDHFAISSISSPQTVGTPISGITLTAQDASNNTATSFTGTVTFGGTGGFSGTSASFAAGVLSGVSVTPAIAGSNLTFTVDDGSGHTGSTAIASIAANTPPTFSGYSTSTPYQTDATLPFSALLATAADADGHALSVSAVSATSAQGGTVVLQSGSILYSPPVLYSGSDTFSVTISDSPGDSVTGTVTVTIAAPVNKNAPLLTLQPDGKIAISYQGIPNRNYLIQRSTDLTSWTTLTTVTASASGALTFTDASPPSGRAFYRLAKP